LQGKPYTNNINLKDQAPSKCDIITIYINLDEQQMYVNGELCEQT